MALVNRVLRGLIGLLIVTLVLSVATGVFYRYVLKSSLYWATEVPNVLLIWIVFMGSVVAFYEKRHIAFTAVADVLPRPAGFAVKVLAELVTIAFLVVMVFYGYTIVVGAMSSLSDALKVPRGYFYICMPLSAALMAACSLENLYHLLRRVRGAEPS